MEPGNWFHVGLLLLESFVQFAQKTLE